MKKYTKQEAQKLIDSVNALRWLTTKQVFTLFWWDLFNRKKIYRFLEGLEKGKSAYAAFTDAEAYQELFTYWKPNLSQRMMYQMGILKDPRYNGKGMDGIKHDELATMPRPTFETKYKPKRTLTKEWVKFDGKYEKSMQDIKLFNGDIITMCWPNAGKWCVFKKVGNEKYYGNENIKVEVAEYVRLTHDPMFNS